jgi:hypothetical protein
MTSRITRSQSSVQYRKATTPRSRDISPISPIHEDAEYEIERSSSPTAGPTSAEKGKQKAAEDSQQTLPSDASRDDLMRMLVEANLQAARDREQATFDRQAFQNAMLATKTTDTATRAIQRKLVDPAKFCGGARDLDRFITQLRRRFETHPQQFQNEADQVDYAVSLLGKWTNNDEPELRSTKMTHPMDWGASLITSTSQSLADFGLFEEEIRRMYGDKDWRFNAAEKAFLECIQGQAPADSKEIVRDFANRIRTNWREAGWEEKDHQGILYDLAWTGLRPAIKARVKPLADEETGRFETIDQLFDKASRAETKYIPPKPPQQQQQPNTQQGQGKGRGKRGKGQGQQDNTPNPRPNANPNPGSSKSNLPPAPWVSTEEFERRKKDGKCGKCGGDHYYKQCPKYGPAKFPAKDDKGPPSKKPKWTPKEESKN